MTRCAALLVALLLGACATPPTAIRHYGTARVDESWQGFDERRTVEGSPVRVVAYAKPVERGGKLAMCGVALVEGPDNHAGQFWRLFEDPSSWLGWPEPKVSVPTRFIPGHRRAASVRLLEMLPPANCVDTEIDWEGRFAEQKMTLHLERSPPPGAAAGPVYVYTPPSKKRK